MPLQVLEGLCSSGMLLQFVGPEVPAPLHGLVADASDDSSVKMAFFKASSHKGGRTSGSHSSILNAAALLQHCNTVSHTCAYLECAVSSLTPPSPTSLVPFPAPCSLIACIYCRLCGVWACPPRLAGSCMCHFYLIHAAVDARGAGWASMLRAYRLR